MALEEPVALELMSMEVMASDKAVVAEVPSDEFGSIHCPEPLLTMARLARRQAPRPLVLVE
jgi:hypothetical protein